MKTTVILSHILLMEAVVFAEVVDLSLIKSNWNIPTVTMVTASLLIFCNLDQILTYICAHSLWLSLSHSHSLQGLPDACSVSILCLIQHVSSEIIHKKARLQPTNNQSQDLLQFPSYKGPM